jgi:CheY-like chemotaxis protein
MQFAQSALDALERVLAAEAAKLILILCDINVPGMSGLDLLPHARQVRPDVPVIVITAYGDPKRGGRPPRLARHGCSPSRAPF